VASDIFDWSSSLEANKRKIGFMISLASVDCCSSFLKERVAAEENRIV
jgi:hypothetical protein